jgi:hypothetical protein
MAAEKFPVFQTAKIQFLQTPKIEANKHVSVCGVKTVVLTACKKLRFLRIQKTENLLMP